MFRSITPQQRTAIYFFQQSSRYVNSLAIDLDYNSKHMSHNIPATHQQQEDQDHVKQKDKEMMTAITEQNSSLILKLEPELADIFSSLMTHLERSCKILEDEINFTFDDLAMEVNPNSEMESFKSLDENFDGIEKILSKVRKGQRSECSFVSRHSLDSQSLVDVKSTRRSKSIDHRSKAVNKLGKLVKVKSQGGEVNFDQ